MRRFLIPLFQAVSPDPDDVGVGHLHETPGVAHHRERERVKTGTGY
jgi:hypothetical protein